MPHHVLAISYFSYGESNLVELPGLVVVEEIAGGLLFLSEAAPPSRFTRQPALTH